jgi:hypothetical protein
MNEQQIKAMVVMSIIDNCTMEINNSGYEQYYINEQQFRDIIDKLVKNIKGLNLKNNYDRNNQRG